VRFAGRIFRIASVRRWSWRSLLIAGCAGLALACAWARAGDFERYSAGPLEVGYSEAADSFSISYAGYERTVHLDCAYDWDGLERAHDLRWDAYAVLEPRLDRFFLANREKIVALAAAPECLSSSAQALGEVVRSGGFRGVLTGILLESEVALTRKFGASAAAGRLPRPIVRSETPPAPVRDHALLVTHASAVFDGRGVTKPGLDRVVERFKREGGQVIYLVNDDHLQDSAWLSEDRDPAFAVASTSGEHHLELATSEITVAGGFFELCQADTVLRAARSHFARSSRPFVVNYPMDATYSDKNSYRLPRESGTALAALMDFDHYPSLEEAYERLGARDFANAVTLNLFGDEFAVRIDVDGHKLARGGGRGPKRLILRFWSPGSDGSTAAQK
jgi:hypothetical protein